MDLDQFRKLPAMGILRGIDRVDVEPLLTTALDAGLKTIEITLNTENATDLIREAANAFSGRLTVGAGTVTTTDGLKNALDAGATFIVSPTLVEEVASHCAEHGVPFFPGALTPTEIQRAWQAGAAMVKVFPSSVFGPAFFKMVLGPFNEIELMAVGGITAENAREYFAGGASAAAFGASIFRKEWIEKQDFDSIGKSIRRFMDSVPVIP